jgi:hypothetical protein
LTSFHICRPMSRPLSNKSLLNNAGGDIQVRFSEKVDLGIYLEFNLTSLTISRSSFPVKLACKARIERRLEVSEAEQVSINLFLARDQHSIDARLPRCRRTVGGDLDASMPARVIDEVIEKAHGACIGK